ncbi:hypothetical protein GC096_19550 [Paenibacillus sp. LMG 31461]|uniref:Glycosyltransferase RgtA/B/C/D-like domain-containing protein n=1 Tax=Paenibacillus plantarum TaxID=2654975 RepID=A0ABX1XCT5_9BACL|nr:hypothetical protein [Paenibacillus plantarum]NOU66239.1 hypothetical protein [Paenibacillus plantarum]
MIMRNRTNLFLIVCIFIISVCIRFYLSHFTASPIVFGDELLWSRLAESLHNNFNTDFRGNHFISQNIFYPLIISVAYFLEDSALIYAVIKLINCILMSAVVFPIFFLTRRIFDNKWLVFILVIASISIPDMFQTALIMQEPLFYLVITTTFYFIYREFEDPGKFLSIKWSIFITLLLYLCNFTKATGLSIFLSYIIYLSLSYILFKHINLKQLLFKYIFVIISFAFFYFLMNFLVKFINGFPEISDLYSGLFYFQLNLDFFIKVTTGLFLISFYTILAFMIMPVIVTIAGISKKNSAINQLNIFIILNTFITIIIIDSMLFVRETSNFMETRIHVRYLFVYFIYYLIVSTYHLYNKNKKIINLTLIVTSSIIAILSSAILEKYKLVYPMLYVDAMMLASFNFYYKYDIVKILFNISIIGSLTIFVYWLCKKKFKQTLIFTFVVVFMISLYNSFCMYTLYSRNYYNIGSGFGSSELKKEIVSINNYLKEQDKVKNIKVLLMPITEVKLNGGDTFRIDSLESMLNVRYSVLAFEESINESFKNGVFNIENFFPIGYKYTNSTKERFGKIDYVITTVDNVIFDGLIPVSIDGVGKYYKIYKVNDERGIFRVSQMIIDRHKDMWTNGLTKVRVYSDKQDINLEFNLNAQANPVDPKLIITDSTNHEEITIVKRLGSTYNFSAHKKIEDPYFEITLKSTDVFIPSKVIPNSLDPRQLSFRLLDIKIIN